MPTVNLSLGARSYQVHVENNSLDSVGYLAGRLRLSGKAAVISDSNVYPLYGERVLQSLSDAGLSTSLHVFEAGEQSKNLGTVEQIANEMVAEGHDRSSFVVALGGGVVGDMAGFIASIYYRGIPFIQIPTTVMAQVDSSVGGKTAVDIAAGKNLIGAFHQPRLVVADPLTLLSLPPRVLREGMAEMVKHAAIRKPAMLRTLRHLAREIDLGFTLSTIEKLPEIIAENIAIKARVVEEDEKETCGVRAFLNLGHTLGHGIEASVPYGELLHGEVVSLGLRGALWLSRKYCGLSAAAEKEVLDTLKALELPLSLPQNVTVERALKFTASDKKFSGGTIRFVLLRAPGEPILSEDVTADDLAEAMHLLTTPLPSNSHNSP
ncbi:MAG: 3-dehydroquinate synthase [Akkermansia sp.]|nr:3-dehydroquinate synthase [Akkermansia sp.]